MTYENIAVRAQASAGWLVAALGFTIPISTAADGILLVLLLTMWLIAAPAHRAEIKRTIEAMTEDERFFAAAYLGVLIRRTDPAYRRTLADRIDLGQKISPGKAQKAHTALESEGLQRNESR